MCDYVCPECGSDHHSGCGLGFRTAAYFEPVYKGGVNINPDGNTTTSTITCHACDVSHQRVRGHGMEDRLTKIE